MRGTVAGSRASWWFWTYVVASFLIGAAVIVTALLDHEPWWSLLPHLLLALLMVAFALYLFVAVGPRRRRQRVKKRSLPPL
ncbi:hypothetical protein [Streptomyces sp. NBC_00989]|uniref:hypothetical protein n=1 Tax=Streptomyces sp. NBC_00989 TaxID=2903705 RepID=UPI00386DE57E|nr:hypothetical protein OG714_46705 [Streptomyces sp. NBC_00989]